MRDRCTFMYGRFLCTKNRFAGFFLIVALPTHYPCSMGLFFVPRLFNGLLQIISPNDPQRVKPPLAMVYSEILLPAYDDH
ncbi:MAG: hypothetical protein PHN71_02510, partial [Candidatus Cloacimonetes bacterium]|nr:hypothetical protein [Candidatus Cloacimonadota bacterium]